MRWRPTILAALIVAAAQSGNAYTFTGSHWTKSSVTMQLQLGSSSTTLSDGSASWGASAEDALATWNSLISTMQFAVVRDSTAAKAQGNGINNVFFSSTVYGQAWGSGVLAVTLTYTTGGTQTAECDVLFNSNLSWDSYRGALRSGNSGTIFDFHRVALHEFGHVVGLDHPDQAGQSVTAVMNSRISNLDALAADDIAGAQSIYGANSATGTAPAITTQPASQTVAAGQSVTFSVVATSSTAMTYQWFKNGAAISGATSSSYALSGVATSAAGSYNVVVTNAVGATASASATLTVSTATVAPSIVTQPSSQTIKAGNSVAFAVVANGTPTPSYQWLKNGTSVSGATASTYSINSVATSDAGNYSVRVTNSAGSVMSTTATLAVTTAPVVSTAPATQTVNAGNAITLSVTASGNPAPTYQWQKNGSNIAGATQSTYSISAAAPTDAGTYAVVVTNAAGSITTVPVLVTVNYSQLVNLSTRGFVPPGGALTAGFFLRGSFAKSLLLRAVGPTLTSFGVTNVLPDPQLALMAQGSTTTLATNDSWNSSLSNEFQSVGAFALPLGSADAASQVQLSPGGYTTQITADATTNGGIALAEVYDADSSNVRTRLVNLSTLGFASSGDNALVAGFSIQGNAPKRLLVRAVGPGLAGFGVSGWMSNPRFDIYPTGQSTPVASNDDWSGNSALSATFSSVAAFPLTAGSQDAAMVVTLDPGTYTAVVTGVNGTTGYVLVELYDLDP